ncbi:hypothetical protein CTAYLR_001581 [Chrysophaeum taylorii]|uniref:RanBD1 domain-containing protein n=1 Tax=Chrysophaeum taylorii TaxID=2483200 RepID=A0AAD7UE91_9STRA|nr:hypothetical protein CTAYLR_001581 [Chrysophaeum taylorii]
MATFGSTADGEKPLTFGSAAEGFGKAGSFSVGATGEEPKQAPFGSTGVTKFGESTEEEQEGGEVPEAESTAEFTPVVQLDEVEVKTHEEDEEVVFKMRAKLFRYTETMLNKGSGKKEWIERGVGEFKLLKHRESEKIRALMRQEKTMKVIANHVVDPRIVLQPNVGNDRSWVWSAYDFSEGDLVEEVFAIRFGTAENASKFKEAFVDAQETMKKLLAGEDGPADPEADKAAEALASLKTQDEGGKQDEPK